MAVDMPQAWQLVVAHQVLTERLVVFFDAMDCDLVPIPDQEGEELPAYFVAPRHLGPHHG